MLGWFGEESFLSFGPLKHLIQSVKASMASKAFKASSRIDRICKLRYFVYALTP